MQGRKLALVVAGVVVLGCCVIGILAFALAGRFAGSAGENAFISDPQRAAAIGHEIAAYDLPAGYRERAAMNLVYKMVIIAPERYAEGGAEGGGMQIMLMQFPSFGTSRDEMERQMRASLGRQQTSDGDVNWKRVQSRAVTVKGQEITLSASEGTSIKSGTTLRQEIGVFDGQGGTVMLMIMGDKAAWDDGALEDFLASIR